MMVSVFEVGDSVRITNPNHNKIGEVGVISSGFLQGDIQTLYVKFGGRGRPSKFTGEDVEHV